LLSTIRLGGPNGEAYEDLLRSDPRSAAQLAHALAAMPEVGTEFLGFDLIAELGRGAFGRVFLARQGELADRPVALKISTDVLAESWTLAQLQHTNIVPVYSVHHASPFHAVCMPFLGTVTLADVLRGLRDRGNLPATARALMDTVNVCRSTTRQGEFTESDAPNLSAIPADYAQPQDPAAGHIVEPAGFWKTIDGLSYVQAVLWVGARLADGRAHAHERGILHRDLKPANVLLTDDGQPLLLDFNLAEDTKWRAVGAAGLGGTLPYMAPEQLDALQDRAGTVDARCDLYALGVILYELLTTRHPFTLPKGPVCGELPGLMADERRKTVPEVRRWNPAATPAVESIVKHCLTADPAHRYQMAGQLREDLQRQLDDLPLRHAPEPSVRERAHKFLRRHPRLLSTGSIAAAAVGLLLVLGSLAWVRGREVSRAGQNDELRAFRSEFDAARRLLNHPVIERLELDEGVHTGRQALNRFGVLETPTWASGPAVALLSPDDRERLREDASQLLMLLARGTRLQAENAREPDKRAALIRAAGELNAQAE